MVCLTIRSPASLSHLFQGEDNHKEPVMKKLIVILTLASLLISCRNEEKQPEITTNNPVTDNRMMVAEGIIYDVIVKPQSEDDDWENERLAGYKGAGMIDQIFSKIYDGSAQAYEYFTGEKLDPSDIRKMEKKEGYGRENIAKIQFTENWFFNPETLEIDKEIISIVPGYEYRSGDSMIISYRAAFRLDLPPSLPQ